jgi:hypothetical protein
MIKAHDADGASASVELGLPASCDSLSPFFRVLRISTACGGEVEADYYYCQAEEAVGKIVAQSRSASAR